MTDPLCCPRCSTLVSRCGRDDEAADWVDGEVVTCPCCCAVLVCLVDEADVRLEEVGKP